jgi:hypothetical protein
MPNISKKLGLSVQCSMESLANQLTLFVHTKIVSFSFSLSNDVSTIT